MRIGENSHGFSCFSPTDVFIIALCQDNEWAFDTLYHRQAPVVSFSDNGKTMKVVNGEWKVVNDKPAVSSTTLLTSGWASTEKTYSFESTYPSATYDIEVALDSTATSEQAEAFNGAQIVGSATSNTIKAYGDVPTVDIPVIIKVVTK